MGQYGILSQRYAKALLDLAVEQHSLPAVREDMAAVLALWEENPVIAETMSNATYAPNQRLGALLALMKNHPVSPLTENFFAVVANNGRLDQLRPIARAFAEAADIHEGIKAVDVFVPQPLKAPLRKKLEAMLGDTLGPSLAITIKIDPSLLDGLQVKVGSILYDASLKKQLSDLQQSLMHSTRTS